jgi:hypothetical protein
MNEQHAPMITIAAMATCGQAGRRWLKHSTPRKLILVGEEKGVDVRIALDVVSTDRRYE